MSDSDRVYVRLEELPKVEIVNILNSVFEDYSLPMQWNLESFERDLQENNVSLSSSFVMEVGGERAGILLISFREKRSRIDLMGVIPKFRRSGIGFQMVDEVIRISKWKGCERVTLEVLKRDLRALSFYQRFGFREKRDLITFSLRRKSKGDFSFKSSTCGAVMEKALEVMGVFKRAPDWQREPVNFPHLTFYNFDLIVDGEGREQGYCVWGRKENVLYVMDAGPSHEKDFGDVLDAICDIARKMEMVVLFPTVPEDDPLYLAASDGFTEVLLIQTELVFRIH
jgi:ribosomal protein S18 acetylase RimI-like enzyme